MRLAARPRLFCWLASSLALAWLFCVAFGTPALAQNGNSRVRVMTRNMDAGTDLAYVIAATTPEEFVTGIFKTIAEVDASNIPARVARLADEIASTKPDLIGLQEVTVWNISDASGTRVYDQLALLQQALSGAGLHYRVVALQQLSDIPVAVPGLFDMRFDDHNAILARDDLPPGHLQVLSTDARLYEHYLSFVLPVGGEVAELNGWMAADVRIRGARFRFANTHLLAAVPGQNFEATAGLQALQGQELLEAMSGTSVPIILAGDFNSDAEAAGVGPDQTETAAMITGAGYSDAWHALHPADPGFTWPLFLEDQAVPVVFPPATPVERIDLVFALGPVALSAQLTGTDASAEGVLASDHAGVVADFALDNHRPDVPIRRRR